MTYTVLSGTLNSTIPYHTILCSVLSAYAGAGIQSVRGAVGYRRGRSSYGDRRPAVVDDVELRVGPAVGRRGDTSLVLWADPRRLLGLHPSAAESRDPHDGRCWWQSAGCRLGLSGLHYQGSEDYILYHIWPIRSWVLACWWCWRFDCRFARLIASVVTITSIILK